MITKNVLLSTVSSIFILDGIIKSVFVNAQSLSLLGRQDYESDHLRRVMEIYKRYDISFNLCRLNDSWQSDKNYFEPMGDVDLNRIFTFWKSNQDRHKACYFDFELLCVSLQAEYGGNISELFYALYVKYMSTVYAVRFAHEYLIYKNTPSLKDENTKGGYFRLNDQSKRSIEKHRVSYAKNLAQISISLAWFGTTLTNKLNNAITKILEKSIPGFQDEFVEINKSLSAVQKFVDEKIIEQFDFKNNDFMDSFDDDVFNHQDENFRPSDVREDISSGRSSQLTDNQEIVDNIIELIRNRSQEKWIIQGDWFTDKRSSLATDILKLLEFEKLIWHHQSELYGIKASLENGLEDEALLIQVKYNSQGEFDRLIMEAVNARVFFSNLA